MAAGEAVHLPLRRDPRRPCRVRRQPLRREWRHRRPHHEWLRHRHGWLHRTRRREWRPRRRGRLHRMSLRHNDRIWLRHRRAWLHHAVRHPTSQGRNAT